MIYRLINAALIRIFFTVIPSYFQIEILAMRYQMATLGTNGLKDTNENNINTVSQVQLIRECYLQIYTMQICQLCYVMLWRYNSKEYRQHSLLKLALDGGTRRVARPRATTPTHPHFLSSMGDGQANAFSWRDTSPGAALSVVLCITHNFDLIIHNYYYKFHS